MLPYDISENEKTRELYQMLQDTEAEDIKNYAADHAPLNPGDRAAVDLTAEIRGLYALLASADALSFMAEADYERFNEQSPGYRNAPDDSYIDFTGAYRDRIGRWQNYAYGVVEANNSEAWGILDDQGLLATTAKLQAASLNAAGYRQLLQADGQTANLMNQALVKLRLDIQRQIEAETRFALNARQERIDARAAFKQAVREWRSQGSGGNY
jgi:hypothetical protein